MLSRWWVLPLFLVSSAFGQDKVGTTGASFLEMSPSVRSNGMGEVGVMLTDVQAVFFNPAALGLSDWKYASLSFHPVGDNMPADVTYNSYVLAVKPSQWLANPPEWWSVGWAYSRVSLSSGPLIERSYGEGTVSGTGRTFEYREYTDQVSAAVGLHFGVEVTFGFTHKRITLKGPDSRVRTTAYDAGLLVRLPLEIIFDDGRLDSQNGVSAAVTIGVTRQNNGDVIPFYDETLSIPKARSFGVSMEIGYGSEHMTWCGLLVGGEHVDYRVDGLSDFEKAGLEVGIAELAYLRTGRVFKSGDLQTYGFGLSTVGLRKLLTDDPAESESDGDQGFVSYLWDNVDVRFDFAIKQSLPGASDWTESYGVEIRL